MFGCERIPNIHFSRIEKRGEKEKQGLVEQLVETSTSLSHILRNGFKKHSNSQSDDHVGESFGGVSKVAQRQKRFIFTPHFFSFTFVAFLLKAPTESLRKKN